MLAQPECSPLTLEVSREYVCGVCVWCVCGVCVVCVWCVCGGVCVVVCVWWCVCSGVCVVVCVWWCVWCAHGIYDVSECMCV